MGRLGLYPQRRQSKGFGVRGLPQAGAGNRVIASAMELNSGSDRGIRKGRTPPHFGSLGYFMGVFL
jgi:hypothetical protein